VTHEERAKWITRGFLLFLAVGILAAVWFYPDKKPPVAAAGIVARHDLEIVHYHLPGNPESERLADYLNAIEAKYKSGQVLVTRVDITARPDLAKAEKVTKPPKVVMMAGEVRACKFQGVWTQVQIERKVEEILRGLKRHGKNWRPEVQGMQTAPNATPAPPVKPAKP
jgi:thioredoxin-like negative regulator of GroEL